MIPTTTDHPAAPDLAAFALGKLDGPAAETVQNHLASCPECRTVVETTPNDTLVGLLKIAAAKPGDTPSLAASILKGTLAVPNSDFDVAALPPELRDHPRYRILRKLGEGGMGAVYEAEHRMMERVVAIKVISASLVDSPAAIERFEREVRAAAKLEHANIVRAYDADQAGGTMLLAMEFVKGRTLAAVIASKGPLPIAYACQCVRQAALGLQHAADYQMVHRDIKPQNLMLTEKGVVKILDFGLAKLISERASRPGLTGQNMVMGTPEYMAPEQARDTASADIRGDIYALGCTLFYLLTGRPPFTGETAIEIVTKQVIEPAPRVTDLRPEVPAELADLVGRMLAKDPAERPQSPKELGEALAPFTKAAKAASRAMPEVKEPFAEMIAKPVLRHATRPTARRSRLLLPTAVAAGLMLGAFIAATVVWWKTPAGYVRLEVPDGAEVRVDGEVITTKPYRITVDKNERKLVVLKDGVEIRSESISIKDDGRTIVAALVAVPPTPDPPKPVPPPVPAPIKAAGDASQFGPPSDYADFARGRWVALLPSAEEFNRLRDENNHSGSVPSFTNGILRCDKCNLYFPPLHAKDAIIRAKARKRAGEGHITLRLRNANGNSVVLWFNGGGEFGIGHWRKGIGWEDPPGWSCRTQERYEGFFEFAFAAVGNKLSAYANGRKILEVSYEIPADENANFGVGSTTVGALFRDVEVQVLDKPAPAAAVPGPAPAPLAKTLTADLGGSVNMEFVCIPAGSFTMGSPKSERDYATKTFIDGKWPSWLGQESPQHSVTISRPFYLGSRAVTVGEFKRFVDDTGYKTEAESSGQGSFAFGGKGPNNYRKDRNWYIPGFVQADDHPVTCVSWNDAVKFAEWLSRRDRQRYRLPTEAEWEYSCRAGRPSNQPFGIGDGQSLSSTEANFRGFKPYGEAVSGPFLKGTCPVDKYRPNEWGLYNMHGNVWQWCSDGPAKYPSGHVADPTGPEKGPVRARRGGAWGCDAGACRAAARHTGDPSFRAFDLGFRLARDVSDPDK